MDLPLFEQLHNEQLISGVSLNHLRAHERDKTVNVRAELTAFLYIGILLLTTGLGILVYKNIDRIGHVAIVLFIGALCAACFIYSLCKGSGFSTFKVSAPNHLFDYVLLLGCLLLLILVGYLQYEFALFGNHYGLAIFFPMVILFLSAYYFDHLGVLSMAITNLAAWVGITISPLHMLERNDFNEARIFYTGIALGVVLVIAGLLSAKRNIKSHFEYTYKNFGIHLLFISLIAAMVHAELWYIIWFAVIAGAAWYFYSTAARDKSFYFLVVAALYFYVALSYVIIHGLFRFSGSEGMIYLTLLYLIFSAVGLILFLIHENKRLKHAGIS